MLRIGEILLRFEQGYIAIKKRAQRPTTVPHENVLIVSLLFREEVFHHPQLTFGLPGNTEYKTAVIGVKRKEYHIWNREIQLQGRSSLRRNPPDFTVFTGLIKNCPGYNITAVICPLQAIILC